MKKFRGSRAYNRLFKTRTPVAAYWLGLLAADGCLWSDNHGYKRVSLGLKRSDKYILKQFLIDLGCRDLKISTTKSGRYCSISISSELLFNDLAQLGLMVRKSRRLTKNAVPKNHLRHFVRGVFDGDGSISFSNRTESSRRHTRKFSFAIYGHKPFLRAIADRIYLETGISLLLSANRKEIGVYQLTLNVKCDLLRLYYWLYKKANRYLNRKKNKFVVFKQQCKIDQLLKLKKIRWRQDNYVDGRKIQKLKCQLCGTTFQCRADFKNRKFCSRKCNGVHLRKPKLPKINQRGKKHASS